MITVDDIEKLMWPVVLQGARIYLENAPDLENAKKLYKHLFDEDVDEAD